EPAVSGSGLRGGRRRDRAGRGGAGAFAAGLSLDVEAGTEVVARAGDHHDGPHRAGDPTLAADYLAHLALRHPQVEVDGRSPLLGGDVDLLRGIDQVRRQVEDELAELLGWGGGFHRLGQTSSTSSNDCRGDRRVNWTIAHANADRCRAGGAAPA